MTGPAFDPEAVIDAMAPMLGLDPRSFDRAAVAENLRIIARFGDLLAGPAIGDHTEPAPVFLPDSATDRKAAS